MTRWKINEAAREDTRYTAYSTIQRPSDLYETRRAQSRELAFGPRRDAASCLIRLSVTDGRTQIPWEIVFSCAAVSSSKTSPPDPRPTVGGGGANNLFRTRPGVQRSGGLLAFGPNAPTGGES